MELYANVIGTGKPFIILHGFLGMGDNWKTLGRKIAEEGYEVHLIDQRNHGRSFHSDAFSYELMADDLKEYCIAKGLSSIKLLGHSMGGKTAMLFASLFPEYMDQLIIADIAPKHYPQHHQKILEGLDALDFSVIKSRGAADKALSEYVKEPGVRMFLLKNLYWKKKGELGLRMNLSSLIKNIEEVGKVLDSDLSFEGSTLFLKGSNSGYIEAADEALIQAQFPQYQLVEITGAGHWLHAEQPDLFLEEVLRFLKK
ncbi:alpha/beta fold hydrolase [Aquimarina brevivitae]|uniref:Pimeloyl-ACP methyl ester carboxylesterase n=1 Tax=Aquimarina brevivitae TaxID=323412 RepID=A0A4Q7PEE9_9FLAO|nr:alpha/beta fold hydrolase [Aquimarina brevivitae]RZS98823.1 pimeloyl-ACP methyl ester carboxylesterase [Aquimarina brevivitae]